MEITQDEGSGRWAWMAGAVGVFFALWISAHAVDAPILFERASIGRLMAAQGALHTEPLSYATSRQPWASPHALYDRLAAGLAAGLGVGGLGWLHRLLAAVCAGAWMFWAARSSNRTSSIYASLLFLFIARFTLASIGPESLAWVWASLIVGLLLARRSTPALRWATLIPVQILWANTAPFPLLGPVLAASWVADRGNDTSGAEGGRRYASFALPLAMAAASSLTPSGPAALVSVLLPAPNLRFWPLALDLGGLPWYSETLAIYACLAVMLGCMLVRRQRLPLFWLTAAACGVALSIQRHASIATLALLSLPFLAISFQSVVAWMRDMALQFVKLPLSIPPPAHRAVTAVTLVLLAWTPMHQRSWDARNLTRENGTASVCSPLSAELVTALRRADAPKKLLHLPADGGALAWARPGVSILADTRAADYSTEFMELIGRWQAGDTQAFTALQQRWNPDGVLLRCLPASTMPTHALLASKPDIWSLAWMDGRHALWVRKSAVPETFSGDKALNAEGWSLISRRYAELSGKGGSAGVQPRIIGAGLFISAMARNPTHMTLAAQLLSLSARLAPAQAKLKYFEAIALRGVNRMDEARLAVMQYLEAQPRDAQAWTLLSNMETARGDPPAAKMAQDRATALMLPSTEAGDKK